MSANRESVSLWTVSSNARHSFVSIDTQCVGVKTWFSVSVEKHVLSDKIPSIHKGPKKDE